MGPPFKDIHQDYHTPLTSTMSGSPSRSPDRPRGEDDEERTRIIGDGSRPNYHALLREALQRIEDSERRTADNEKRMEELSSANEAMRSENTELRSILTASQQPQQ